VANQKRRRSLADAFGEEAPRRSEQQTSEPVNTAQEHNTENLEPISRTGEVEMVPGGRGEMVPADKPVNMTFTVTAKERYLWTLELKRRGRTAVSVLRDAMEELAEQQR
jgi:hypothetical protein